MEETAIKVTFPHMGTVYIVLASLVRSLGGEVIIPPYTNKKTLSIGVQHSPEAVCLPYKLLLGNYIEAVENGAEALLMISSPGICRLGEYGKGIANAIEDVKDQRVKTAFFMIGQTKIELLESTDTEGPIGKFLDKKGEGIHHIAFAVKEIEKALTEVESKGIRLIDKIPRKGAENLDIAFLHPKSTYGVLTELCEKRDKK